MYDRRLDAIVAAAELGSFSKAADRLNISTPALVKQVTTFEREHNIVLFERSHTGVATNEAGASLVEDARRIMAESASALQRARSLCGGASISPGASRSWLPARTPRRSGRRSTPSLPISSSK